jgi:hypothetical protein
VPAGHRGHARAKRPILARIGLSTTEIGRQREAHAVNQCPRTPSQALKTSFTLCPSRAGTILFLLYKLSRSRAEAA